MAIDDLIISVSDIRDIKDISANVADAKIEMSLTQAQELDIKTFLGDDLYYDMLTKITSQKYINLIGGSQYTNAYDNTVYFKGLAEPLKYFAYARFIQQNDLNVTRYGNRYKNTADSVQVDYQSVKLEIDICNNIAKSYLKDVEDYLNAKKDVYPLWRSREAGDNQPSGMRVTKVSNNYREYGGS